MLALHRLCATRVGLIVGRARRSALVASDISSKPIGLIRRPYSVRKISAAAAVQEVEKPVAQISRAGGNSADSIQMSAAEGCLRFINYAWTQFHAVGESSQVDAGGCILYTSQD